MGREATVRAWRRETRAAARAGEILAAHVSHGVVIEHQRVMCVQHGKVGEMPAKYRRPRRKKLEVLPVVRVRDGGEPFTHPLPHQEPPQGVSYTGGGS